MTTEKALALLRQYNAYRRDNACPPEHPMPDPVELGKAIERAIYALECLAFDEARADQIERGCKAVGKLKEAIWASDIAKMPDERFGRALEEMTRARDINEAKTIIFESLKDAQDDIQ
jgi:hypothetical protein